MRPIAYWLTMAFIFSIPWENAVHLGGLGRGSKVLGIALALVWAGSILLRRRLRNPDGFQKAYFLLVAWSGLTFYWSIDAQATTMGFLTYAQLFFMVYIVWDMCDTETAIENALQAYVLGAYIASLSIVLEFLTAQDARFPQHERLRGLGTEVDGIALIVAIAVPAAWYLAASPTHQQGSPGRRLLNFMYVPVGLFAVVITGTRGATLALLPAAIFVFWSLRHARPAHRLAALGTLVAAILVLVVYAPRGPLARIQSATTATELGSEDSALSGRWSIWVESSHAFLDRPILGAGLDAHRTAVSQGLNEVRTFRIAEKEAHNTYISVLVETGIVGFAILATMIVIVVKRIRRLSDWRAWYWSAQVSVLAIGAMSLSLEDSKSIWIFLSLCVATSAIAGSRAGVVELVPVAPTPGPVVAGGGRRWQPAPQRPR
ncbi:MAG TPA: O-antigen ligase family protein [Gaiellaceae bacterium]|nr:O-antigen ligase family protein [Gaiellaceae bacterium]